MAGFQRFEEIEAWQMARELTRMVYAQSGKGEFKSDFALRDQIRKAAVSIMSNIAEGFERVSPREFAYHVGVAKGSAGEVRAQLYVALDQGYVNDRCSPECKTARDVRERCCTDWENTWLGKDRRRLKVEGWRLEVGG